VGVIRFGDYDPARDGFGDGSGFGSGSGFDDVARDGPE